ncbi:hypothetical protein TNIN_406111 [Trichonephila inaurata madagascariensis]|uniref:Uncharacterized protein n=1 Tax=Trichonephila inaurata madagascariensis TaxID=2747483 RepID=A0A8X6YD41_9ARAC|nr:hypothetical protein TNIN_406111 [Trichonephila inaurata madagascariensis]
MASRWRGNIKQDLKQIGSSKQHINRYPKSRLFTGSQYKKASLTKKINRFPIERLSSKTGFEKRTERSNHWNPIKRQSHVPDPPKGCTFELVHRNRKNNCMCVRNLPLFSIIRLIENDIFAKDPDKTKDGFWTRQMISL